MTHRIRFTVSSLFVALITSALWFGCAESLTDFEETEVDDALIAELSEQLLKRTGNGAPSGPHFNLNLIGVPKDKSATMDGNNGHRIFVKLYGNTKIYLREGDYFDVLDANGTDSDGARFQLPNPDPDGDGTTVYSVYARPLGKWGGSADIGTCATNDLGEEICSMTVVMVRSKGKSTFQNISKYLLYVYADLDGDGSEERYALFDDVLQDYLWNYNNDGLKLMQLRFYEEETTVDG